MAIPALVYAGVTYATRALMLAAKRKQAIRVGKKAMEASKKNPKKIADKGYKKSGKPDPIKPTKSQEKALQKKGESMSKSEQAAADKGIDKFFGNTKPLRMSKAGKDRLRKEKRAKANKEREEATSMAKRKKAVRGRNRAQKGKRDAENKTSSGLYRD